MTCKTFLLAALGGTLAASAALAGEPVTFQLDWLPGGDKAPIYVCIDQGFCAAAGLDVTIASGRGSSDAISRLAAGSSDIGMADLGAVMAAKAQEDVAVTGVMSVFNKGPHAFYTVKDTGFDSVADAKGRRIATSPFTSSNVYLPLVLEDAGLSESDLELTKADAGALGPMLMTGQVDGIVAWMTDLSRYQGQGRAAGREIVALPWSAAGLDLYSASLIAGDGFLAGHPDRAERFVAAFRKSVDFCRTNPEEAAQSVVNMVPELELDDVLASLNDALPLIFNEVTAEDGLGVFEPGRLAETWGRVAKAQGLEEAAADPESFVSRAYLAGGEG
ncbi:ABC transporter substrate-binding protein [Poseidonocella sp. HB161398]|uniref:ABC transporter substrate-binding protein n=1 Tax=Poseidonocella sp. HB161398 TaxID=2320855 RepID=UPI001108B775|nr:ABC transporter substrate-binding protein [Poseidonocella sp. HB161398]